MLNLWPSCLSGPWSWDYRFEVQEFFEISLTLSLSCGIVAAPVSLENIHFVSARPPAKARHCQPLPCSAVFWQMWWSLLHFTACICWGLCFPQPVSSPRGQELHLIPFIALAAHCRISGYLLIAYVTFAFYEDQGFHVEPLNCVPPGPFQLPESFFFQCTPTATFWFCSVVVSFSSWSPVFSSNPSISIAAIGAVQQPCLTGKPSSLNRPLGSAPALMAALYPSQAVTRFPETHQEKVSLSFLLLTDKILKNYKESKSPAVCWASTTQQDLHWY